MLFRFRSLRYGSHRLYRIPFSFRLRLFTRIRQGIFFFHLCTLPGSSFDVIFSFQLRFLPGNLPDVISFFASACAGCTTIACRGSCLSPLTPL